MSPQPKGEQFYKQTVTQGSKAIRQGGLVEFGEGNVSIRVEGKGELYITPTRNDYDTMTVNDVSHIQFDGTSLGNGRAPSSEYRLHVAVYSARPKANCVIHTHSPYASMLSMVKQKIPILFEEALLFLGGEIQVADYGESGTEQIGINAIKFMGSTNGVLMENHGVLVCGRTMEMAVKNALLVEKLAKIYIGARSLGEVHTVDTQYWNKFLQIYNQKYSTSE